MSESSNRAGKASHLLQVPAGIRKIVLSGRTSRWKALFDRMVFVLPVRAGKDGAAAQGISPYPKGSAGRQKETRTCGMGG